MLVLRGQPLPRRSAVIADDELWFAAATAIDEEPPYEYRGRVPKGSLFYPSRRGGSPDNSDHSVEEDYRHRLQQQAVYVYARAITEDEVFAPPVAGGIDEDPPFAYRARVPQGRLLYPSRRGGSPDGSDVIGRDEDRYVNQQQKQWTYSKAFTDDDVFPTAVAAFGLDDDNPGTTAHRVPQAKLFYPSRRGGSPDNNDAIVPIGVDDDPWRPQQSLSWKYGRAITDDEVHVVRVSEDYLLYAFQQVYETPLVSRTDEEELATPTTINFEDEWNFTPEAMRQWRLQNAFIDDDTIGFVAPVVTPAADGGRWPIPGGVRKRERLPEDYERERSMVAEYLESLEQKQVAASVPATEPVEPVASRLSEAMASVATTEELERIERSEQAAEEDRQRAEKEHRRRRAAAAAVLMMFH